MLTGELAHLNIVWQFGLHYKPCRSVLASLILEHYAPVIFNHVPSRAGDNGGIAGLKHYVFTFEVSQ